MKKSEAIKLLLEAREIIQAIPYLPLRNMEPKFYKAANKFMKKTKEL